MKIAQSELNGRPVAICECKRRSFSDKRTSCPWCKQAFIKIETPLPAMEIPQPVPVRAQWESISPLFKVLRKAHGWSQKNMEKRFHVPRTYFSKIETGSGGWKGSKVTATSLERFAAMFGMSVYGFAVLLENCG